MAEDSPQADDVPSPEKLSTIRNAPAERLPSTLVRECEAMLLYALDHGKELGPELAQQAARSLAYTNDTGDADLLADLMLLHARLSALIAPASGRTLVLFEQERMTHPYSYIFGSVRLARQTLAFAVLALILTVLLSTSPQVNTANVASGWFALSGKATHAVIGFLLAIAGLGAAFSNLSIIGRYIENANYDPVFEGGYWVRVALGLISGVVLGEILFNLLPHADKGENPLLSASQRVVFAFLGGFATAPVQQLLSNLSDAIGMLLQGKAKAMAGSFEPSPPQITTAEKPATRQSVASSPAADAAAVLPPKPKPIRCQPASTGSNTAMPRRIP